MRRKPVRRGLLTTAALAAGSCALLALPPINDPTEGTFTVLVVNNTRQPLKMSFCHNDKCSDRDSFSTEGPGEAFWQNIAADVDEKLLIEGGQFTGRGSCRVLHGARLHNMQRLAATRLPVCPSRATAGQPVRLTGER